MKRYYTYLVLLSITLVCACTKTDETFIVSEESLKEMMSGANGKTWVLNVPTTDCNSNSIGITQQITLYPSGKFESGANLCDWDVRVQKSPVDFKAYLVLGNNTYKILPVQNGNSFHIFDESQNLYAQSFFVGVANAFGLVTDVNNNTYNTKIINGKNWMLENLKTTRYNDGVAIISVPNTLGFGTGWDTLGVNPGMSWKSDDIATMKLNGVGAYYNFYAVATNKLCPAGWHVATTADWNNLIGFAGGDAIAADALKSTTISGGTNSTGFNGIETGFLDEESSQLTSYGIWWVNQSATTATASSVNLTYLPNTEWLDLDKRSGLSVRCVQD